MKWEAFHNKNGKATSSKKNFVLNPKFKYDNVELLSPEEDWISDRKLPEKVALMMGSVAVVASEYKAHMMMDDAFMSNQVIPLFPRGAFGADLFVGAFALDDIQPNMNRSKQIAKRTALSAGDIESTTAIP